MATVSIKILEILEKHFEPAKAKSIAHSLEEAFEENNRTILEKLATKEELKEMEVRILRWMVTLWVTQMLAILALFFKK